MSDSESGSVSRSISAEDSAALVKAQAQLRILPDLNLGLMHRMNNVMTSVSFTLEALEEEVPAGSAARDLVAALADSIRDAHQIIRRTTEVNQSLGSEEAGYHDLNSVLRADQDLYRFVLPKGADLRIETASEPMVVRACSSSLRTLILPLLADVWPRTADECRVDLVGLPGEAVDRNRFGILEAEDTHSMAAIIIRHCCDKREGGNGDDVLRPSSAAAPSPPHLGLCAAQRVAVELGGCVVAARASAPGPEYLVLLPQVRN